MCTKGFLNYLSAIVVFLNVVFKDEVVKFSKNCGTVKPEKKNLLEIFEICKRIIIIIIINCHNGLGKPRKFSMPDVGTDSFSRSTSLMYLLRCPALICLSTRNFKLQHMLVS